MANNLLYFRKAKSQNLEQLSLKAQDFQVCVTVIEARQLAGLNMDPVVCVQVKEESIATLFFAFN